jgi:protein-disulfide isomerase-like protein with CxxC motif
MKTPAEYVAAQLQGPSLSVAQAEQAVAAALADAERYRYLLLRAIQRAHIQGAS